MVKPDFDSTRLITRKLATISIAGFFVFLIIDLFMHFVSPEIDPAKRYVSEYILSTHGWLMNIAFVGNLIGCATFTYAFYLSYQKPFRSWICIICLSIATLSVLTNFFPADINGKAVTISGHIHNLGAFLGSLAIILLMVIFSLKMRLQGLRLGVYQILIILAVFAPISFAILLIAADRVPGFIGIIQRIYVLIIMTWLILASLGLRSGAIILKNEQNENDTLPYRDRE